MAVCTFFGHRDCPETIKPKLREVLLGLITNNGVTMFYVGNNGRFDEYVHNELQKLKKEYQQINCAVVISNLSRKEMDYSDTIFPEGIEGVPPRYAISWCNNWMLKQSDYVVAYVVRSWGGAKQFVDKAKNQGKTIINLI